MSRVVVQLSALDARQRLTGALAAVEISGGEFFAAGPLDREDPGLSFSLARDRMTVAGEIYPLSPPGWTDGAVNPHYRDVSMARVDAERLARWLVAQGWEVSAEKPASVWGRIARGESAEAPRQVNLFRRKGAACPSF